MSDSVFVKRAFHIPILRAAVTKLATLAGLGSAVLPTTTSVGRDAGRRSIVSTTVTSHSGFDPGRPDQQQKERAVANHLGVCKAENRDSVACFCVFHPMILLIYILLTLPEESQAR